LESINSVIKLAESSRKNSHRVAACGEIAPLLWSKGNAEAAFQLERMWDEIVKTYALDTLCAYPVDRFRSDENDNFFERICADHPSFCSR